MGLVSVDQQEDVSSAAQDCLSEGLAMVFNSHLELIFFARSFASDFSSEVFRVASCSC